MVGLPWEDLSHCLQHLELADGVLGRKFCPCVLSPVMGHYGWPAHTMQTLHAITTGRPVIT